MRILFEIVGGPLTTRRRCADIDTTSLTEQETAQVEGWVKQAHEERASIPKRAKGRRPRGFEYVIKIEEGDAVTTLEFDDKSMPESLRPFLSYLTKQAKSVPVRFE